LHQWLAMDTDVKAALVPLLLAIGAGLMAWLAA
jgi:hypothetical protein